MLELTVNDKLYLVCDGHTYTNIRDLETHQILLDNQLVWTLVHYKSQKRFALQGYMKRRELRASTFAEAIKEITQYLG